VWHHFFILSAYYVLTRRSLVNTSVVYFRLSRRFFFSLVFHDLLSLVRVLLTVSSHEIYWKYRGTFQNDTIRNNRFSNLTLVKIFLFFIIRERYRYWKVDMLLDLSVLSRAAPCAASALGEKSVVLRFKRKSTQHVLHLSLARGLI